MPAAAQHEVINAVEDAPGAGLKDLGTLELRRFIQSHWRLTIFAIPGG